MAAAEAWSVLTQLGWFQVLGSMLAATAALLALQALHRAYLHPLSRVPGPKLWAGSALPFARSMRSGQHAQNLRRLHLRYGPVVRVAPDELSFTDAAAWPAIYAYSGGTSFPKSPRWFRARANRAFGIIASPNAEHARFRRTFAPAFTDKALAAQEGLLARHVAALVAKLERAASSAAATGGGGGGKQGSAAVVNMTDELEFAAFDIAGDFAFSEPFGCLDRPDNRPQIRFVQAAMKGFADVAMQRMLGLEAAANLVASAATSLRRQPTVYQKSLSAWTRARLDKGEGGGGGAREDLMEVVARGTSAGKASRTLSPAEAENAVGDFMIASTETVASTTVAALHFLLGAPAVLAQLRAQLRAAFPHPQTPDKKALADLPLLNAVIDEVMRLAPSIPSVLARMVPAPGAEICGYFVPGGIFVAFSQYAAYRSPSNFSEPDRFLPQRWINPEAFERHNADAFHPFSVGPRNCIGKVWGLMAVRSLLASILLRFELSRAGPDWAWEEQDSRFIWEKKQLLVRVVKSET